MTTQVDLKELLIVRTMPDFEKRINRLRGRLFSAAAFEPGEGPYEILSAIVQNVHDKGDAAVVEYTEKFDHVKLNSQQFRISAEELEKAHAAIDGELLKSLRKVIKNVKNYQTEIFVGRGKTYSGGCGVRYTPIEKVGICVPGASAPLPSTVIMTAVPAIVAGVKRIAVVSPPRCEGSIHPVTLAVCHELGIKDVFRIGGAQAVAALAIGTAEIPKVHKIVGPGNQWVQTAKKYFFGKVDIDSIAGPSEVLILANFKADAAWIAADMLSQTEHDPGSAVVFTDSKELAEKIIAELQSQVVKLTRSEATLKCLRDFSAVAVFKSLNDAIEKANDFAPEHLQIHCGPSSKAIAEKITNAGAIFIGDWTPVAVGDYFAGPSHTLPTGTSAKFFSALSSNDFVKATSIIEYDEKMLRRAAVDIVRIAEAEGLDAHAKSVRIRMKN